MRIEVLEVWWVSIEAPSELTRCMIMSKAQAGVQGRDIIQVVCKADVCTLLPSEPMPPEMGWG